jgi:hypothetical protein
MNEYPHILAAFDAHPDGAPLTAKRQAAGLARMKAYLIAAGAAVDAPAPLFSDTTEAAA